MAGTESTTGYKGKKENEKLVGTKGTEEVDKDIDEEEPGFAKGGKTGGKKREHRKDGGKAEGEKPMHRPDRAARGGGMHEHHRRASGGRTPYSTGSVSTGGEAKDSAGRGHEDVRPPKEPD
jgi:hypothetical protein